MSLTYTQELAEALEAQKASLIAKSKQDAEQKVKAGYAKKKPCGHTKPKAPIITLAQEGRLRVCHLLAIFGVSHSTLYAGIKSGRYPKPSGFDGKIPYWNTETIRQFLQGK